LKTIEDNPLRKQASKHDPSGNRQQEPKRKKKTLQEQ
jgi:hypothetical protein